MYIRANSSSGGVLNPTVIKAGVMDKTSPNNKVEQEIDLTKTYIVSISGNMQAYRDYMDTFVVNKGVKTIIHDTAEIAQDINVTGNILSFTNGSTSYYRTYCITQLD